MPRLHQTQDTPESLPNPEQFTVYRMLDRQASIELTDIDDLMHDDRADRGTGGTAESW
ncbi:hypothetical protein GA0115244_11572 [Streptomyces sp. DvalAA-19]|nr:hypothetical protein GA0115244_11572 [Streptomyces sp. DvalAA-19]